MGTPYTCDDFRFDAIPPGYDCFILIDNFRRIAQWVLALTRKSRLGVYHSMKPHIVGEPRPKFGKLQGRGAIKGLKADSYVKQPAGSESGLRL